MNSKYRARMAVRAMGRTSDPGACDRLIRLLDNANARYDAARALGELRQPAAVPALVRALQAEPESVAIAEALISIGDVSALPGLVDLLDELKPSKGVITVIDALDPTWKHRPWRRKGEPPNGTALPNLAAVLERTPDAAPAIVDALSSARPGSFIQFLRKTSWRPSAKLVSVLSADRRLGTYLNPFTNGQRIYWCGLGVVQDVPDELPADRLNFYRSLRGWRARAFDRLVVRCDSIVYRMTEPERSRALRASLRSLRHPGARAILMRLLLEHAMDGSLFDRPLVQAILTCHCYPSLEQLDKTVEEIGTSDLRYRRCATPAREMVTAHLRERLVHKQQTKVVFLQLGLRKRRMSLWGTRSGAKRAFDDRRGMSDVDETYGIPQRSGLSKEIFSAPCEILEPTNDESGNTLLHEAVCRRSVERIRDVLNNGTEVNASTNQGLTALHLVARDRCAPYEEEEKLQMAALLLERDADPNAEDQWGWRPLHYAAATTQSKLATLLISRGADARVRNADGLTPLHTLQGGRLSFLDNTDLRTAFIAHALIRAGCPVNARDSRGNTALHLAVPYTVRSDGESASWVSAFYPALIKTLILSGARVGIKNARGETFRTLAAEIIPRLDYFERKADSQELRMLCQPMPRLRLLLLWTLKRVGVDVSLRN